MNMVDTQDRHTQDKRTQDKRTDPEGDVAPQHWSAWIPGPLLVGGILTLVWIFVSWELAIVILGIIAIVTIHELGHYIGAKRGGMKVTEFFIGFGPKLWSVRHKETEYGIKAIPLGAYVRIPGMYMTERNVAEADEARSFRQQPFRPRLFMILAGPATHFVTAILLFVVLFSAVGYAGINPSTHDISNWSIDRIKEDSPAEAAGLRAGDKIIAVNGSALRSYGELVEDHIKPSPGESVVLTINRGGDILDSVNVTLSYDPENPEVGRLGIFPQIPPPSRVNPVLGVGYAFRETGFFIKEMTTAAAQVLTPSGISNFVSDTFSPEDEVVTDPNSSVTASSSAQSSESEDRFLSLIGLGNVGEIAVENGVTTTLLFFIFVSLIFGLINSLPILPLDGGHAAVAIYERIRSRGGVRYHADANKMIYLVAPIMALLLFINVVAFYRDIIDPFN